MSARKFNSTIREVHWGWLFALLATSFWVLVPGLTPFATKCGISLSLFAVIKTHVLTNYRKSNDRSGLSEVIAWFVAWPGLDAKAFFPARTVDRPRTFEWMFAVAKTGLGGWMLIGMAPALRAESDLLAGWSALIGIGSHHPGATLSGFGLLILGIAF